jgi:hypothetical protein
MLIPVSKSVDSLASSDTAASVTTPLDSVSVKVSADHESKQVLVTVVPPSKPEFRSSKDTGKRAALDICCVIDVSGSMSEEATIAADPATSAPAERTGLSVLDVVKHALRTIISTMQEGEFPIIAYTG